MSSNQNVGKGWLWSDISIFSNPPAKWFDSASVRIMFFICMCCLFSAGVSCVSVHCPFECTCYNSSIGEHGEFLISINCSSLGLVNYTLDMNAAEESSIANLNSTTTPDKDQESVHATASLYYLDLSHNKLISLEPDVQADNNSLNHTFRIQVHTLIFSFNYITQIQFGHLSPYVSITNLDLSHNQIELVDADAFVELVTVSKLNLSHNAIDDFANNTFKSLNSVKSLDLSFNKLKVFSFSKLTGLFSLQHLYLNNNNMYSVTAAYSSDVLSLPCLVLLDISNNFLTELPSGMFNNLHSMKTLNMANNSIQEVSEYFLQGLQSLEDITLDFNNISAITKPIFRNTSMLRLSIASMASLSNISHDAFQGMTSLLYLNLSHNLQLRFLQPNLFTSLANLQVLDVSGSSLTQLSQITFFENTKLQEIHLLDNPFDCSCTNAWLATEARSNHTKFLNADSLFCSYDGALQTDFNNASFDCQELFIHNMSSRISAKLGSQLLFMCQLQAENPGVVMWTTPSGQTFYQHHFHPDASQHLLNPEDIQPGSKFHKGHTWHYTSSYYPELSSSTERILILSDGSLYIDYMLRSDAGPYKCHVSNVQYNQTLRINLYVDCTLSSEIKIFGCIVGLICALSFFTLNLIYVISSWIARRLVNKRRREIIRQMLENLNAYKSTQIGRIHENYTHQISRVRNQYNNQCARLHRNYTGQVGRMKRGCSNQVEKVRENYNSKLAQLRDYSSNQIMQIRERANNQIIRIRDYGSTQLDKLRETYKFQQQHVLKLLDTMNLENCRNIVETECMRAESMMYDIDLLGDDDRTDSPSSPADSEYSTAASSPSSSLDDHEDAGLRREMSHKSRELSTDSSENGGGMQMQTTIHLEAGLPAEFEDTWKYGIDGLYDDDDSHEYLMNIHCHDDPTHFHFRSDRTLLTDTDRPQKYIPEVPLPTLELHQECNRTDISDRPSSDLGQTSDSDNNCDGLYMTPESSPTKVWSEARSLSAFQEADRADRCHRNKECDNYNDTRSLNETIV